MAELFKKIANIKIECEQLFTNYTWKSYTCTHTHTHSRQQFEEEIDVNILILCKTECVTTFHVTAKSFRFFVIFVFPFRKTLILDQNNDRTQHCQKKTREIPLDIT